jgi:hypothetical protein
MGLRSRLSSMNEEPKAEAKTALLTPMMTRFIAALESIQDTNPTFGVFARKFANLARKKPVPDEVLRESLEWTQAMIQGILTGELPAVTLQAVPDLEEDPDLEDMGQALLEAAGGDV